ncbi:TPA: hypothetical protein EYP12_08550 [Candidatus Bipolaricaulota bacterium]|nr:hypothetical protein [Candidatus Bipolaricaulota bacterium]
MEAGSLAVFSFSLRNPDRPGLGRQEQEQDLTGEEGPVRLGANCSRNCSATRAPVGKAEIEMMSAFREVIHTAESEMISSIEKEGMEWSERIMINIQRR